ncbi:MAG: FAD-binding oxidoreductase [Balneolales bacterium]|nr:FAD-binding oxidoreductase [Balneolales bacterium]
MNEIMFVNSKDRSWWEKDSLVKSYDLIIIGAGITGLSTAMFFKRNHPKKEVLILERGFYPTGATSRNAGFACFGTAGELLDDLQNESETEVRQRLHQRFNGLSMLKNELGAEAIGYQMTGGYELFDQSEEEYFQDCLSKLPTFNTWVQEASGEGDTFQKSSINGFDAIFNPLEGYLHSGKLIKTLAEKVLKSGVDIRYNTSVEKVKAHQVELSGGFTLETKQVLVATNGFASQLVEDSKVKPARGYVFVTNELEKMPWEGTFHYNKGYVYFRNLGKRLLIGGARDVDKNKETSFKQEVNPKIKQWLIEFVYQRLEIDTNWKIDTEWTGTMGFGATKSPDLRRTESGVYLSAGLGGMGVAIGMDVAKRAVKLLESEF